MARTVTRANADDTWKVVSPKGFAQMCVDPVLRVRVDLGADLSGWL